MRCGVLAAALGAAAALAQPVRDAPESPPAAAASAPEATSAEAGRRVYTSYCARCHGINLVVTSSAYFDLRTFPRDDKARFLTSVTGGKRAMPAWGGIVTPQQMESIWAYLGQVNGW